MRRLHDSEQTVQKLKQALFDLLREKEYNDISISEIAANTKPIAMGMSFDEVYQQGIPMRKIWADYAKTGQITRMKIDGMIEIREL